MGENSCQVALRYLSWEPSIICGEFPVAEGNLVRPQPQFIWTPTPDLFRPKPPGQTGRP